MHWVVKLVSAWGVHTCVHEPMLNICVGTYMLCVICMCCAAFVCGLCLCVLDMHTCCMFVCSEIVCLFSQRVLCIFFFSFHWFTKQQQPSPSRGVGDTLPAPSSPTCPLPRR